MGTPLEEALGQEPVSEEGAEPIAQEQQAVSEPEPEAQADDTPPAEPEPSDDEPKDWSYHAYKDQKTKRQEAEKLVAELTEKMGQMQRQNADFQQYFQEIQAQQQQQADPQGYQVQELVGQQVGQVEAQMRLNMSRMMANNAHGADKVSEAEKAFYGLQATDPSQFQALYDQFGTHQDPIGQIMQWHKRHEIMSKMGDDPAAYIKAQAEEMAKQMAAEMGASPQASQQQAPATPQVMPTDLSQTRNVGTRTGSMWSGPTDLSAALGET